MINHLSLNGILCDVDGQNPNIRHIKVIRSYKNKEGNYPEDLFPCMMWSRTNKNSLFSYKSGTLVSLDGRIETVDGRFCIIVESMTLLCSGSVRFEARGI